MSIIMTTHQNVRNLKRMRDIFMVTELRACESTALLKPLKPYCGFLHFTQSHELLAPSQLNKYWKGLICIS